MIDTSRVQYNLVLAKAERHKANHEMLQLRLMRYRARHAHKLLMVIYNSPERREERKWEGVRRAIYRVDRGE